MLRRYVLWTQLRINMVVILALKYSKLMDNTKLLSLPYIRGVLKKKLTSNFNFEFFLLLCWYICAQCVSQGEILPLGPSAVQLGDLLLCVTDSEDEHSLCSL